MTKKVFTCPKFNIAFTSEDEPVARIRALKGRLTKGNISIFAYLQIWGIAHYELRCAWCKDHNHDIKFIEHEVINGEIHPTKVRSRYKAPYLCYSKTNQCESKKLNRNSIQFITKAYGLNEDQALEFLHKRSKSPFYPANHPDLESYKRSQSRGLEWWKTSAKDRNTWIAKANHSRSLQGYIDKHGDHGYHLWKQKQKLKVISLERFIEQYGASEGSQRYQQWTEATSHSLDSYITKYGKIKGPEKYIQKWVSFKSYIPHTDDTLKNAIERITQIVSQNPMHEYQTFNVDKEMKYYKWYHTVKDYYDLSTTEVDTLIQSNMSTYKSRSRQIFKNPYSYYSYTNLGTILKSNFEILVYDYLIDLGLVEEQEFMINKRYPCSTLVYDLWLIRPNVYLELAGMMTNKNYSEHMRFKEQNLSSIIIYPETYKDQIQTILGIQHANK